MVCPSPFVIRGIAPHIELATWRPLSPPRPWGLSGDRVPFHFTKALPRVFLIHHYMRALRRVGHLLPFSDTLAFYRTEDQRVHWLVSASHTLELLDMIIHTFYILKHGINHKTVYYTLL